VEISSQHWDTVYSTKEHTDVSWFQANPALSLHLITSVSDSTASVVDIGAGESLLVDFLLDNGYSNLTVVDISEKALAAVRSRLGDAAHYVTFAVVDITEWEPDHVFDVWHDRAVFHFLTDDQSRSAYIRIAERSVREGGHLIIGTFANDGPEQCSGLPTARYSPEALAGLFTDEFDIVTAHREEHTTPWGSSQNFSWVVLQKKIGRDLRD
jgi:SAM-dependent methyltransferase